MGCSLDIATGTTGGGRRAARLLPPHRWRRLAAAALIACTGAAAACSSSSTSGASASAHAPIKVGYLLPLTGIFTKNGTSEQNGFKLGLKHFGTSVDGHTKAEILIAALKSLHGSVTSEKALSAAMRAVSITAPRGPVSLNRATWSPVQNEYICKVEDVSGTMRNVPIVTVTNVPPWGTLSLATWTPLFAKTSVSQPSP